MQPPKKNEKTYNQDLIGIFGSLGSGDTKISYIQTSINIDKLDDLGLVCEIPGSEKWPIRQLFQRDIDISRVGEEIIPYFQNSSMAKFFNPLTIAVLPIDKSGKFSEDLTEKEAEPEVHFTQGKAFEISDFYKVSYSIDESEPPWGQLNWNSSKVKLIAIDGQHRLSALKRIKATYDQDRDDPKLDDINFQEWSIPIVLVTVGHIKSNQTEHVILEKTRNIFVTINKQARPPSRSRTILLNDYSISAICCQEILDSYSNKVDGVPLAVFDWREFKKDKSWDASPHLTSVDELEDLLIHYLLGEDDKNTGVVSLSCEQNENLFADDMDIKLRDEMSDDEKRKLIKDRFNETILPAFNYILVNIKPYNEYIKFVKEHINKSNGDIEKHAWSRLVYGSDFAPDHIEKDVKAKTKEIIDKCQNKKENLGYIFSKTLGLRAIYSAFSIFSEVYRSQIKVIEWESIAELYVKAFNSLYDKELFESGSNIIRHICEDHNLNVVNYKLEQIKGTLGNLIAYMCLKAFDTSNNLELEKLLDKYDKTLLQGFKKELRPKVKEDLAGKSQEEINEEVSKRARKAATRQKNKVTKKIDDLIAGK